MQYTFNKDELKESLSIDQVFDFVAELGGEPKYDRGSSVFVSKTICHNHIGEGSYKLYYYDNTHLFKCYTDCGTTFDIYELVRKVKILAGEQCSLPRAIAYVASYFGIQGLEESFDDMTERLDDWNIITRYEKTNEGAKENKIIELKVYDGDFLKNYPKPHIIPWELEGIKKEIMDLRGICYDPINDGIIIPHHDINNRLIGIRERTLIKENEVFGKYRPAYIHGKMYNHPLGFNLYNLNNSKDNIKAIKKVIVFEGEKSPMLYASYYGNENDITVASCGSSLIAFQVQLLLSLGVEEIIVAYDKQFQEIGDEEWKRWTKKLQDMNTKYSKYCQMSFLFDKWNLLGYKDGPIDKGAEVFEELFKRRIIL